MEDNRISRQLREYLAYKRSLGFRLYGVERVLRQFSDYTLRAGYDGPLTQDIVLGWVSSDTDSDKTMGRRIEAVRPFSKYAHAFDPDAQVMQGRLYGNTHERPVPYIFREDEVVRLMEESRGIYSPDGIRAYTIGTVIGLLWATGMRPSEPARLTASDVDFTRQLIRIRNTKFAKERIVPVDGTVARRLQAYRQWIERKIGPISPDSAFFYTTGGAPLTERALQYAFKLIRPCIDARPAGYPNVRLYDLRHTMACNTVRRWLEQGADVNASLHVLSAYMGHSKPEDTFWYLSATPELMRLACSKYEARFGGAPDET